MHVQREDHPYDLSESGLFSVLFGTYKKSGLNTGRVHRFTNMTSCGPSCTNVLALTVSRKAESMSRGGRVLHSGNKTPTHCWGQADRSAEEPAVTKQAPVLLHIHDNLAKQIRWLMCGEWLWLINVQLTECASISYSIFFFFKESLLWPQSLFM